MSHHREKIMNLNTQLMEKYLHSQGAALLDEGRVDEAISFFERAIVLDDRSYTRCDLSLAFVQKNDLVRSLQENGRAIALNPQIARYYYERSRVRQMKGNESEAHRDLERAISLDGNYSRIEEIQEALRVLEEAASSGAITISHVEERIKNPELRNTLAHAEDNAGLPGGGLESVSCTLPCPAFCCHFEGSPLLHGVSIGPWKLLNIRELLKQKGLAEGQFLDRIELSGQHEIQRLIPPHHLLRERGGTFVYSPKKGRSTLHRALVASRPKGRSYQDLFWIHSDSWECSFLQDRRCMIHDVGDEPALPACKEFLCLTGFVFVLLARWGLIEEKAIGGKTMGQLNRLAVEAALILSAELCRAEDVTRIKASLEEAVFEALNADREDNSEKMEYLVIRIQDLSDTLTKAVSARKATVRRQVVEMLEAEPYG
jgi:hypothetical protein